MLQLPPTPAKNPFGAWNVTANVARVRFSVVAATGGRLPSTPTRVPKVMIAPVSLETLTPFTRAVSRTGLCDGTPRPAPQRNALVGVLNPSGWPRPSTPA